MNMDEKLCYNAGFDAGLAGNQAKPGNHYSDAYMDGYAAGMNEYRKMDYDTLAELANLDDEDAIQELDRRMDEQVANHTPRQPVTR